MKRERGGGGQLVYLPTRPSEPVAAAPSRGFGIKTVAVCKKGSDLFFRSSQRVSIVLIERSVAPGHWYDPRRAVPSASGESVCPCRSGRAAPPPGLASRSAVPLPLGSIQGGCIGLLLAPSKPTRWCYTYESVCCYRSLRAHYLAEPQLASGRAGGHR